MIKRIIGVGGTVAVLVFFKMYAAKPSQSVDSPQFRADFVKSSTESCLASQAKSAENKDLTVQQLTHYCACMANAEVNEFNEADYRSITKSAPVIPTEIQARIDAMAPACVADIVKEMMHKN